MVEWFQKWENNVAVLAPEMVKGRKLMQEEEGLVKPEKSATVKRNSFGAQKNILEVSYHASFTRACVSSGALSASRSISFHFALSSLCFRSHGESGCASAIPIG